MLGVTFFGLFLTPVFNALLREVEKRVARGSVAVGSQSNTAAHYHWRPGLITRKPLSPSAARSTPENRP
jgi:hypothetical protein